MPESGVTGEGFTKPARWAAFFAVAVGALLGLPIDVLVLGGTMPAVAVIAMVVWGFAFGVLPVAPQTFMFSAAPGRLESASAIFVSVFQLSVGAGALVGGLIVDHSGLEVTLWAGAASTLLAAVLVWIVRQRSSTAEPVVPA
ncbi:hypothetical protein ACQPZQ_30850 [Pseudonocardia sp. CA-142604]|uniref:hypothetical protein n=1 Tax=Pseudonocardia sp. CA-142604 TaxID=3240024 RepID=UPI003D90099D